MVVSVLYRYRFLYCFVLLGAVPFLYSVLYPPVMEYWFRASAHSAVEEIQFNRTGLLVSPGEKCPNYGVGLVPDFLQPGTTLFTAERKKMCGCVFVDLNTNRKVLSRLNSDGSVSFLCGKEVITLRFHNER